MTLVHQLMTWPVVTCPEDASLRVAAQLMWERDCGVVPVVDVAGVLVGILTDRDVCMAAYTQGKSLAEIDVRVAMSADVVACRADDSTSLAAAAMERHQVRRLPVVDDEGRPVGLLSINDLLRHAAQPSAGQRDSVFEVTHALAAIGRARDEPPTAESQRAERAAPWRLRVASLHGV